MDPQQVVQSITMGSRIAEDERDDLSSYFVETENWRKVYHGEADVIFAPKGGGKSAIYSMLMSREGDFFDRGILLATAENPSGGTAFAEVETAPPTSEAEFIGLWKIYFLTIIAQALAQYDLRSDSAQKLSAKLSEAGLLPPSAAPRRQLVRAAMDYVKFLFRPASVEATMTIDPNSGAPVVTPKITFAEPTSEERRGGALFVDELFDLAQEALDEAGTSMWILLDRLDIAFADSPELEANALRALFRVYRDLEPRNKVHLKIFLRSDIWEAITKDGFREASHITRDLRIDWNENTLLRLAVQRLLRSADLRSHYGVDQGEVLSDIERQRAFFYRVFPPQIDQGSKKPSTLDWCLSRTKDGTGRNAPRELIHLLSETRNSQLNRFETGQAAPEEETVFDRQAFKEALPTVSKVRLTQTLYAEQPTLRPSIERLEGQKTRQNAASLASVWGVSDAEATRIAEQLVVIGFFEPRLSDYWVPFMYRPALEMVQGSAEGVAGADEE
ncbi:P-loop ATPase, Sll1717 family [Angustibacter sp. McL0619]|uniref:P-loop ATPase, Sll1717 family n=1 Tax=Angustibacter sp. McL0619 TaxID=3415676 RepID=UPI003CEB78A3